MALEEILFSAASKLADAEVGTLEQLLTEMRADIHDSASMRRYIENHDDGRWIWRELEQDRAGWQAQLDAEEHANDARVADILGHDQDVLPDYGGHHHGHHDHGGPT